MCIHTHLTRAKNKPLLVAVWGGGGLEGAKLGVTRWKEKFDPLCGEEEVKLKEQVGYF